MRDRLTYWNEELKSYLLRPEYLGEIPEKVLINRLGLLEDEVEWNGTNSKTATGVE